MTSDFRPSPRPAGPPGGRPVSYPGGSNPGGGRGPQDFAWLIDNFAASVPGVTDALVVAADGLLITASGTVARDMGDQLAAITSGLLSLAHNSAALVGRGTCEQIMLRLSRGHLLFMRIGDAAGLAVLTDARSDLKVVAFEMAQLVTSVGHVLTPQMRAELHRITAGRAAHG